MKNNYIKGFVLSGLIALIGLSSCQVMNKYESPQINSDNLFRDANQTDTTTIADILWREYFKDPLLQAYINEGLNNNFDMLITTERIKQAEAMLGQARAAYFPDVALSGQVEQTRLSNADPLTGMPRSKNNLGYHKETYTLGIVASWELDIWGKLNRQSKAKYADMLNSYAGRNLIQTSLISNIANTYYSILALDEQLIVTNEMIGLMDDNLLTMDALKEAGLANGAAVEQSRAALYSAKTSIHDLESNISQLENALCVMLGRAPVSLNRATLSDQIVPARLTYGIPAQMLAKRPDVQQAELSFRSAFELRYAAKAGFYPSVTLNSGTLGFSTVNGLSNFFKPENLFASIVAGLTQPLFAKKRLIAQYDVAKAEQQATLLAFEKTVLAAGQEVSDIMAIYESATKKMETRAIQVESLMKAVDYTRELLIAGEATYLEVLTAQQGLLDAQLNQVNDKLQQLQATSNLYRALGGGIE
ncbi:efflux transporter outer membrane subunit [Dysgonomonas macrotermitis]|uniref:Efflux transporter, outer membrane factor (OMF) lipoprotein, NodT family n=1 Tax=Dysgonomonas macrotermitis TaxID=1346286 RepID=A0A1M5BQ24_9BACT|nr:efflux transporter outer membrane subunit [Dysgonomonas macrotermitis]SHF44352.1 efflux transporter, outer membrane factor (OMF) lipoprotein, NodT family [Dysgonomonas macrotermitis]